MVGTTSKIALHVREKSLRRTNLFIQIPVCSKAKIKHNSQTFSQNLHILQPGEWNSFITSSKVVKIIRDRQPKPLADLLETTLYTVPRKPQLGRFFDGSRSKWGRQSLQNRVTFLNAINEPWLQRDLTDDGIRILMTNEFFEYKKSDL